MTETTNEIEDNASTIDDDRRRRLQEVVFPAAVQVGDSVSGRLTSVQGAAIDISVVVTQVSPLGVGVLVPRQKSDLRKGHLVEFELSLGGQTNTFSGIVVESVESISDDQQVAIRLLQRDLPRAAADDERRSGLRWLCGEQFFPTAIAANPARYNDFVYLRFRDLSRTGARVVTSLRNKFIVRGMRLECLVSFPLVSQIRMELAVRNVTVTNEGGKDLLSVGVEFESLAPKDVNVIAQYLLQFGDTESLESLREAGLVPTSMGKAVDYSFVRTEDEYEQVLQLRAQAYGEAGKLATDVGPQDMADPFDAKSKIIIGKYKGRVVSTARLYFPEYGDVLEQEEFVSWSPKMGRRDEVVEIMRVCTHKDFRRSDLLFSLFRFIAITAIQAKRTRIVGCATDDLLPLYEKVGIKSTGLSYNLPALNNLKHWMIMGDAKRSVVGLDVGPFVWNALWRDTAEYLVDNQFVNLELVTQVRLMLYRAIGPLAQVLRARSRKPRPKRPVKESVK